MAGATYAFLHWLHAWRVYLFTTTRFAFGRAGWSAVTVPMVGERLELARASVVSSSLFGCRRCVAAGCDEAGYLLDALDCCDALRR